MALNRVRIADVADSLGLSTATVSKVIHGKTEKISDETVKRVQQELERSGYIPNMAVSNILSSWLRCKEHATIPFLASFGAVAVNTGLNYLLVFGKLGLPCMGIKGAAVATLISQLFNLVFIVIGFILCIRKDGDKPVWSSGHVKPGGVHTYMPDTGAYRRST